VKELRRLVVCLSTLWHRFDATQVQTVPVRDKMAVVNVSLLSASVSPVSIIPPKFHVFHSAIKHVAHNQQLTASLDRTKTWNSKSKKNTEDICKHGEDQLWDPGTTKCEIEAYGPITVAQRSNAKVYGRSLAGIETSNPAAGMDISLLRVCILSGRGLCVGPNTRPRESSRLCVCV
jgi:hypothetical protein